MRLRPVRAVAAGPRLPPDLGAFGLRALDAVGARLGLLFLVTALAGIPLAAGPSAARQIAVPCAAVLACAVVVALTLVPGRAAPWTLALAVTGPAASALLAGPPAGGTWDQSGTLAAWVAAGLASGVAAARGPSWGLTVSVPTVAAYLVAGHLRHIHVPAVLFLGAATYFVGGACTNVLARRGFAATGRALEAVAAARAAQRVAEERWQARRQADRVLHDTVLATLAVLAHQGIGIAPGQIRAACARDLAVLAGGNPGPATASADSANAPARRGSGGTAELVIEAATACAAALGLELRAHLGSPGAGEARLGDAAASALRDAVAACVTNIWLHADIDRFDLAVTCTSSALAVLIVDEGRGFDPGAVPEDSLGLRASVAEPLSVLGGSVTIWSRPGEGTSVRLRLPLPQAES